jgi:hypothetical protein
MHECVLIASRRACLKRVRLYACVKRPSTTYISVHKYTLVCVSACSYACSFLMCRARLETATSTDMEFSHLQMALNILVIGRTGKNTAKERMFQLQERRTRDGGRTTCLTLSMCTLITCVTPSMRTLPANHSSAFGCCLCKEAHWAIRIFYLTKKTVA